MEVLAVFLAKANESLRKKRVLYHLYFEDGFLFILNKVIIMSINVLTMNEIDEVSGAIGEDTLYGTAVGAGLGLLGLGLTVTAPVWGTAALLGASIFSSGLAIYSAWE